MQDLFCGHTIFDSLRDFYVPHKVFWDFLASVFHYFSGKFKSMGKHRKFIF